MSGLPHLFQKGKEKRFVEKMNVNESKQLLSSSSTIVVFDSDDSLYVMRVPRTILETESGKEIIDAITGKDTRYSGSSPNEDFIHKIYKQLIEWSKIYSVGINICDADVVYGSEHWF